MNKKEYEIVNSMYSVVFGWMIKIHINVYYDFFSFEI